jgi:hypothetical protein
VLALEHQGVLDVPSSGGDLSLVCHSRASYWLAGQFQGINCSLRPGATPGRGHYPSPETS